MPNALRVDFFRVRIEEENVTFESLLAHIGSLTKRRRNLDLRGDVLRLHVLNVVHQTREGDMTRIRLQDLPSRASLEGDLAAIDLAEGEGLAEQAAFLFIPATQVLVLQRNRHSITAGNFAYYVESKGGSDAPIFLDPVLQENAIQRLADIKEVRRFDVRFAKVNNAKVFRGQGRSTKELIDILEYFSAPSAGIVLSMGHQKGSLPVEKIKSAARALFGQGRSPERNEVTRIEITGTDEDGEIDVLDLIKFKMVESVGVEAQGKRLPYSVRRDALREAYERRQHEINRMFTAGI